MYKALTYSTLVFAIGAAATSANVNVSRQGCRRVAHCCHHDAASCAIAGRSSHHRVSFPKGITPPPPPRSLAHELPGVLCRGQQLRRARPRPASVQGAAAHSTAATTPTQELQLRAICFPHSKATSSKSFCRRCPLFCRSLRPQSSTSRRCGWGVRTRSLCSATSACELSKTMLLSPCLLCLPTLKKCNNLVRYTWGCNSLGQLGLGHTAHRISPVLQPSFYHRFLVLDEYNHEPPMRHLCFSSVTSPIVQRQYKAHPLPSPPQNEV